MISLKRCRPPLLTSWYAVWRRAGGGGGGGVVDPRRYPQQILCLAEQVLFTERCEVAIAEGRLAELLIELESQLDSYTSADISVSCREMSDSLSSVHVYMDSLSQACGQYKHQKCKCTTCSRTTQTWSL